MVITAVLDASFSPRYTDAVTGDPGPITPQTPMPLNGGCAVTAVSGKGFRELNVEW